MKKLFLSVVAALALAGPAAAEFSISFEWGNIPLCTTGKPNKVGAPAFLIKDLPPGTQTVQFRLKDLDVPSYNHGGGKLRISSSGRLPFGSFKYKSPCPPGGRHTYEWTATARNGGKVLGVAKARRKYPE